MKKAFVKSLKSLWQSTPLILGILLLISLVNSLLTKEIYAKFFGHSNFLDAIIGSLAGSISGGSPINSYILGGEFLKQGVSMAAVTAFLFSWVTVGFIQVPVEAKFLGIKFAIWRNISSFILAIIAGIIINLFY